MNTHIRRLLQCNFSILSERRIHCSGILRTKLQNFSQMGQEFKGTEDRYNGILVDSTAESCQIELFPEKLKASLNAWKFAKRRGIWFKIALEHTNWVPVLAENGFDFHHAKNGYVMMYKWLPLTSCGIPVYAHTMFAVGALVVNDKSQILVVKERHFLRGHWKFPGGMVEPGEHLIEAAKREVKEETNITFDFTSLVSFMHADKGTFGCSDFYVLVAGQATSDIIKKCDREIIDCIWIDIDEYLEREDVTFFNKLILQQYLDNQKNNIKIGFSEGVHKLSKRNYRMYNIDFIK